MARVSAYQPSGDCYSVAWQGDTATVKHFVDHETRRVCCAQVTTITVEDLAAAHDFEKQKGATAALRRLPECTNRRKR